MLRLIPLLATVVVLVAAGSCPAEVSLGNDAFRIDWDASGIRSLKRANDVADTNYIASGESFGGLLVRYRSTPNGDWRELREMTPAGGGGNSFGYRLGMRQRSLAERSSASANQGAGGLRALNDGIVPTAGEQVPLFSWTGKSGEVQWVQYSFPEAEEISSTEIFWIRPPKTWRLVHDSGDGWQEAAAGPAQTAARSFSRLDFEPVSTRVVRLEVTMDPDDTVELAEWRVGPPPAVEPPADLRAELAFTLNADHLDWTIRLENTGDRAIEIGDLGVPFPFAERTGRRGDIYTKRLLRHSFVAGHGSFVYWQRSNGVGPYLVMTPADGTHFEYVDGGGGGSGSHFTPYIHARAAGAAAIGAGANWRLPLSGRTIAPGESAAYGFRFRWADDFAAVRDVLVDEGGLDINIVPGMVVPTDLSAQVAIRSRRAITAIEAEHPAWTRIEAVAPPSGEDDGVHRFRVRFSRLGENLLRVHYGDGAWASLEFFATEPVEMLIKKRAAFLAGPQQHKDPSKWYLGAYGDWDQKNEILRGPEDRDGLSSWLTDANDDAGNARPAFLASKNVFFPVAAEIESLELYISRYLWGGMQMTGEEKYPYAIYGIPNFRENRASADPGRDGRAHVWRIYDYPHIIMLYHRMYQIASYYPDLVNHLDAETYLERAYRTAIAYWTVPMEVEGWSANSVGTMNEAFIPELIGTLEQEGKQERADALRGHWESKVRRFVLDPPNLYGSEFAFDSTGFESTGAFANYALTQDDPEFRREVPLEAAKEFAEFQLRLNMSARGWLEASYYQLGSDYRNNPTYLLSYMSQMGGGALLDHGMHFAEDPTDYLRLGYASALSSWALVNSGTPESGFGYWFPSEANDGAAGGGFMPEPEGRTWIGKRIPRGSWYYSAEADVGFCGALRIHATIVARDPLFGEIAYGGDLVRGAGAVSVIPRDGLRVRFHVIRDDQRLHLELERDGFAPEQPVIIDDDLGRIEFTVENRSGDAHPATLRLAGLPDAGYRVMVDGRETGRFTSSGGQLRIELPIAAGPASHVSIRRAAADGVGGLRE